MSRTKRTESASLHRSKAEAQVHVTLPNSRDSDEFYSNIKDTLFLLGRVIGEESGDVAAELSRWQTIVHAHADSLVQADILKKLSTSTKRMVDDLVETSIMNGYSSSERVSKATIEDADRKYLLGLSEKYVQDIWERGERGPQLVQGAVADAVHKEMKLMAVDTGIGRPQFWEYSDTRAHWSMISDIRIEKLIRFIIGNYNRNISSALLRSIARIVAQDVLVDKDDFAVDQSVINLANGIYDLNTYELKPHSPDYHCVYINSYMYDPTAKCPTFDEQIALYAQYDDQWIRSFWEIVGACLSHENPYQKMFWFLGSGSNGKGTVLRILTELVGKHFTLSGFSWDRLSTEFFLTAVENKRTAICGDADKELKNAAALKQLTGGDRMLTNVKYGAMRSVDVQAKVLIALNRMPRVETGEALYALERRVHCLPFDYKITEDRKDPNMDLRLLKELPGVFNRAIEGLKRLRMNGNRFTAVDRGTKKVQAWLSNTNLFQTWITENCILDPQDQSIGAYGVHLWQRYREYMNKEAEPTWLSNSRYITNAKTFTTRLKDDHGLQTVDRYLNDPIIGRGSYLYLFGIRLMDQTDRDKRMDQARAEYEKMTAHFDMATKANHDREADKITMSDEISVF